MQFLSWQIKMQQHSYSDATLSSPILLPQIPGKERMKEVKTIVFVCDFWFALCFGVMRTWANTWRMNEFKFIFFFRWFETKTIQWAVLCCKFIAKGKWVEKEVLVLYVWEKSRNEWVSEQRESRANDDGDGHQPQNGARRNRGEWASMS